MEHFIRDIAEDANGTDEDMAAFEELRNRKAPLQEIFIMALDIYEKATEDGLMPFYSMDKQEVQTGNRWTVIADWGNGDGSFMTSVTASSPAEACAAVQMEMAADRYDGWDDTDFTNNDTTREEATKKDAEKYTIIACLAGEHDDVMP